MTRRRKTKGKEKEEALNFVDAVLSRNKVLAHLAADCYQSQNSFTNNDWEANMASLYEIGNDEPATKEEGLAFANMVLVAMDGARKDRSLRSPRTLGVYGAKRDITGSFETKPHPGKRSGGEASGKGCL